MQQEIPYSQIVDKKENDNLVLNQNYDNFQDKTPNNDDLIEELAKTIDIENNVHGKMNLMPRFEDSNIYERNMSTE